MPTPYVKNTWLDDDTRYNARAAAFNAWEAGIFDAEYTPTVKAYSTLNSTLATGVLTRVTLNAEAWDTDAMHDLVTNPTRITIKTAGTYVVTARLGMCRISTAINRQAFLIHSSAGTIMQRSPMSLGSSVAAPFIFGPQFQQIQVYAMTLTRRFAANDFIEMAAFQDTGANVGLPGYADWCPSVEASLVAY
jgi:hypothetical protein